MSTVTITPSAQNDEAFAFERVAEIWLGKSPAEHRHRTAAEFTSFYPNYILAATQARNCLAIARALRDKNQVNVSIELYDDVFPAPRSSESEPKHP
jgi:hypothetical protein